jgi:hypothetical protein
MKTLTRICALAGIAAAMLAGGIAQAQPGPGGRGGGGNFDPAEFRQRMMERLREQFGVKNDAEWKIIEERIAKVNDARRDLGGGPGGFAFARGGGRGGGGGDQAAGGRGGNRRFGGGSLPEADALNQAVESGASAEEIKAKLAKYREAKKAKEAALAKAQDELRKVLSVKQEAVAVLNGLLD